MNTTLEVIIEICSNCSLHLWCTRHKQEVYLTLAQEICKQLLSKDKHVQVKIIQVGRTKIGSFQITCQGMTIFSKLNLGYFPHVGAVTTRLFAFMEDVRNGNDLTKYNPKINSPIKKNTHYDRIWSAKSKSQLGSHKKTQMNQHKRQEPKQIIYFNLNQLEKAKQQINKKHQQQQLNQQKKQQQIKQKPKEQGTQEKDKQTEINQKPKEQVKQQNKYLVNQQPKNNDLSTVKGDSNFILGKTDINDQLNNKSVNENKKQQQDFILKDKSKQGLKVEGEIFINEQKQGVNVISNLEDVKIEQVKKDDKSQNKLIFQEQKIALKAQNRS